MCCVQYLEQYWRLGGHAGQCQVGWSCAGLAPAAVWALASCAAQRQMVLRPPGASAEREELWVANV